MIGRGDANQRSLGGNQGGEETASRFVKTTGVLGCQQLREGGQPPRGVFFQKPLNRLLANLSLRTLLGIAGLPLKLE